ncbi:hypothetical protein AWH56_004455 [Anaerobacillus isosaccharinicus]|uniref:Uncharacterized protein n=1 Tax=Anaerobacillus isosaccharinicus TaxID=1532552 RepID=A0A1S2LIW8_9BACI|nr:hypothetical protein [Anaerobacillus isosaccharinicus]MBA5584724.1 hypothetical protein [Anaerobacillus isosaccharinicus]QOY36906.1 hypothetical protein AWH56_004455 [Anaerobacillus isosaccharinicus]
MDGNTQKALNLIGIIVFGGWFLTSLIEASNNSIKYSTYTIWEFRFFIISCAVIYYLLVYYFNRKSSKKSKSQSESKAS